MYTTTPRSNVFARPSFRVALRNLTFAVALAAAGVGVAGPVTAQGNGDTPAPTSPAADLEPIAADGFEAFMGLMEEFARAQFEKLPSADKSARENAYGQLAALQLAGAGSALLLPATGLALGGGIGLCVDVCTGGADLGSGTVVGGSIGLGSGMVVGGGAFVASLIATLPMVDAIEAKYPAEAGTATAASRGRSFAAGAPELEAAEAAAAGLFESYYVNLVSTLPDPFITLFERWDRTPGLGAQEKAWLRSVEFARPHLQRLAWIKRNQRVSESAPRANDLFMDVGRVLSGDEAAIERAWLGALGLGSTGLAVDDGKLTLDVPPPLRAFGLPARLSANVPAFRVRVGGSGGGFDPFLRFTLESGPFDLDWGTVSVVESGANKDLIAVRYSLAKGARLGSAKITIKAGGDETKVLDLRPTLDRTLAGTLYFRLNGLVLEFQKADIGGVELAFGIPKEIRDLPIVKDLLSGLLADVQRDFAKFLRDTIPFAGLFDGFGQGSVASLTANVKASAGQHGLTSISEVTRAEVRNGVVRVHVRGRALNAPALGDSVATAEAAWRGLAGRPSLRPLPRPVGKLTLRPGLTPKGLPGRTPKGR
jgi:hypothetical protein